MTYEEIKELKEAYRRIGELENKLRDELEAHAKTLLLMDALQSIINDLLQRIREYQHQ